MENKNEETRAQDDSQAKEPVSVVKNEKEGKHEVMTPQQFEEAKLRQNLPMGIIAGIVAGVICAALWAVITVLTKHQIGYMAIGVGAGVGVAVRFAGKGITNTFGIMGAIIALLSCGLGNLLSMIGLLAEETGGSFFSVLSSITLEGIIFIMKETFEMIDVLFYILAVSAGYSFAFKKVQVAEK